jgi:uncharacterized membrane protein YidH (DUF202 family)
MRTGLYSRGELGWRVMCMTFHREAHVKLIGVLLIVFGIVALAMGGFSYTKREKVLDIGPLQATTETQKTVPIAPIVGVVSVVAGIALVVVGSKARV